MDGKRSAGRPAGEIAMEALRRLCGTPWGERAEAEGAAMAAFCDAVAAAAPGSSPAAALFDRAGAAVWVSDPERLEPLRRAAGLTPGAPSADWVHGAARRPGGVLIAGFQVAARGAPGAAAARLAAALAQASARRLSSAARLDALYSLIALARSAEAEAREALALTGLAIPCGVGAGGPEDGTGRFLGVHPAAADRAAAAMAEGASAEAAAAALDRFADLLDALTGQVDETAAAAFARALGQAASTGPDAPRCAPLGRAGAAGGAIRARAASRLDDMAHRMSLAARADAALTSIVDALAILRREIAAQVRHVSTVREAPPLRVIRSDGAAEWPPEGGD